MLQGLMKQNYFYFLTLGYRTGVICVWLTLMTLTLMADQVLFLMYCRVIVKIKTSTTVK